MKRIICIALCVYSVGILTYVVSGLYRSLAGCTPCFKKETAFTGGEGTTGPDNRVINLTIDTKTLGSSFPQTDIPKIENVLNKANSDWNNATDGSKRIPFKFRLNQSATASNTDIVVKLVDVMPSNKKQPSKACMALAVDKDEQTGQIRRSILFIKRAVFNNLNEEELAALVEHELGHVIGLDDVVNHEHCQSIMANATTGCKPLSTKISAQDVNSVNKYVESTDNCNRERGKKPAHAIVLGTPIQSYRPIIYYPKTCIRNYEAIDVYRCWDGCRRVGYLLRLVDNHCV
jgi:hypothetical protein